MDVALAAMPSPDHLQLLPVAGQVPQQLARFLIAHDRAHRNFDLQILAHPPLHAARATRLAALGREPSLPLELEERIHTAAGPQQHAASLTAVSAVWPPQWHVLLTMEMHRPRATISGFHVEGGFVKKRVHELSPHRASCWPARCRAALPAASP